MPKIIKKEIRDAARRRFFEGESINEIAESLTKEFDDEVKVLTIRRWSREEDWRKKKHETEMQALAEVADDRRSVILRNQDEALRLYHNLAKKSGQFLNLDDPDHPIFFEKSIDAVRALDTGLQGEHKIMMGTINAQLIASIYEIIAKEITDENILRRIATGFQKLSADAQA